tara:strand:- start:195 stop:341 length:147 start_codon:yes stop_codon:yes gene_type:complete
VNKKYKSNGEYDVYSGFKMLLATYFLFFGVGVFCGYLLHAVLNIVGGE